MTPLEFSLENAIEIVPDETRRALCERARYCAEIGEAPIYDIGRYGAASSYWDSVERAMERIVWLDAYYTRVARLSRLSDRGISKQGLPNARTTPTLRG